MQLLVINDALIKLENFSLSNMLWLIMCWYVISTKHFYVRNNKSSVFIITIAHFSCLIEYMYFLFKSRIEFANLIWIGTPVLQIPRNKSRVFIFHEALEFSTIISSSTSF